MSQRKKVFLLLFLQKKKFFYSNKTLTGTWSEGWVLARSALWMVMPVRRSAMRGESKAWSMRRPISRSQAPA